MPPAVGYASIEFPWDLGVAMAKIEDLISQIADERLKAALAAEVREIKKTKKFGLVFEEHLPETVRLPGLKVRAGELVARKRNPGNDIWRVTSVRRGVATVEQVAGGQFESADTGPIPLPELVVVRTFGEAIYPSLVPVDRVERGGPEKPWHVLINADNFHALQLLLYTYSRKGVYPLAIR